MNLINDEDMLEFVAHQESPSVCPASDFMEGTIKRVSQGVAIYGDPMPWVKTHDQFRFRPSEVSIWAGVNGNGKSLVMGQCAAWLTVHTSVLIASMEMKPEATMGRMVRQVSGVSQPSEKYIRSFFEQTENLYIYDQLDTVASDRILGMCHWAATKRGVKHIMIDSMTKCGLGEDTEKQAEFVDKLCWVAKRYSIHVHLVVHMRKGLSETEIPDKFSVKGSGAITDLADNLIIVSRNQSKDKAIRENRADEAMLSAPDGFLRIAKQRHGEWEGTFAFWWDEDSQQWIPRCNAGPMPWPSPEARYGS